MEEVKVRKNNNINFVSIIIIMLVIGVLLGAGGSYYYFEILNSDIEDKVEDKKEVVEEIKLSPDSLLVRDLVAQYDYKFGVPGFEHTILYLDDEVIISELNDNIKQALVVFKIGAFSDFTEDEYEDYYKLLFGNNEVVEHKDIYVDDAGVIFYTYDPINNKYIYNADQAFGWTGNESVIRKIYDTEYNNSELIIRVAAGLEGNYEYDDSTGMKVDVKNFGEDIYLYGPNGEAFDIDRDYEQLTKYEYNYKYVAEEGYYYLDNITKIK